jgi:2-aminoadipate transaminase
MLEAMKNTKVGKRHVTAAVSLNVEVSRVSGRPIFAQLYEQIEGRIANGDLKPGTQLPPVRTLASALQLNPMTVARAYKDLAERGLVESRAGGGTRVRSPAFPVSKPPSRAAPEASERPLLSERLYELSHAPGVIAFTANFPAVDEDCAGEFKACLAEATSQDLRPLLHYDPPAGRPALRGGIADYLREHGIAASNEQIIVTSGAQQAIDMVVRTLVAPGSPVIVERPAYYGVINTLRAARARILEVPLEDDGMDIAKLEMLLSRHSPTLIYTNPTFQNPTGITTSEDKRTAILKLARKYGAAILEDDQCPELRYSGCSVAAIRARADAADAVFYVRSFGKVFLPGSRLGYVVTPAYARRSLLATKAQTDLHTNSIMQEAMALFMARRNYIRILDRMNRKYGLMQKALIEGFSLGMPTGAVVSRPQGGLSLWITLPERTDVSELYFRAVRRGVAFVAGEVFYASHVNPHTLRVSFGSLSRDALEDGVRRLCSVANDLMRPRSIPNPIIT